MEIKTFSAKTHKVKAVVYGKSWVGKTTFGATAPKPIFASSEGGLLSIADKSPDYVEIKSIADLKELLTYLRTQKHKYETVIIDSITDINETLKAEIEKSTGKSMQLQDWGVLSKRMREILKGFRDLDMHVLFIAQETMEKDGENIAQCLPSLNGKLATEISYFMDIVGYITIDTKGDRKVWTNPNPKTLSKDRTKQIGNNTAPDFSVWVDKVKGIEISEEEVVYETPAWIEKQAF